MFRILKGIALSGGKQQDTEDRRKDSSTVFKFNLRAVLFAWGNHMFDFGEMIRASTFVIQQPVSRCVVYMCHLARQQAKGRNMRHPRGIRIRT